MADLNITTIDWGNEDAELDGQLLHYFVPPTYFESIRDFRKTTVLGRKGTGKSALLVKLNADYKATNNVTPIVIKPTVPSIVEPPNWAGAKKGVGPVILKDAWLTLFLANIARIVLRHTNTWDSELVIKHGGEHFTFADLIAMDVFEAIGLLVTCCLDAVGNQVAVDAIARRLFYLDVLRNHIIKELGDDRRFALMLDDLDKGWDNLEYSNSLLKGLFDAKKDLEFLGRQLKCIVFMRTDVFDRVMATNMQRDKFDVLLLKWTKEKMKEMLVSRIRFAMDAQGVRKNEADRDDQRIFEKVFEPSVGSKRTEKWIFERTLERPRDAIQMVKLYTGSLRENYANVDSLVSVEHDYSLKKTEELAAEYMNEYQDIAKLFSHWSAAYGNKPFRMFWKEFKEFGDKILRTAQIAQPWLLEMRKDDGARKLANVLYDIGVIGDVTEDKVIYGVSRNKYTPRFENVEVHPCFRVALGWTKTGKKKRNK